MRSIDSTRKVPVPVAGSRIWTKGFFGGVPFGISRFGIRSANSSHEVISASPSSNPNSVFNFLSTMLTINETTGWTPSTYMKDGLERTINNYKEIL